MRDSEAPKPPKIEPPADQAGPEVTLSALKKRIRQQEILAELGVLALQGAEFEELLAQTASRTADGLEAEFCKVLQHIPEENRFLVKAGVGWSPGVVGEATVGADLDSPAGFALVTGKPVISNHLENEVRFRTPDLLRRHGVHRAMNVILQGDGRPFGVLEVDSRDSSEFEEHDLAFLQGSANLLGMAIERDRHTRMLKAALEREKLLLKEMNHRVKNSLAIVSAMLNMQAREAESEAEGKLVDAANRVAAIARAHERLIHHADVGLMDIGAYLMALCEDLDESVSHCDVRVNAQQGIKIETSRAISTALIVNELIANTAKHAYPNQTEGRILITVEERAGGDFAVAVRHDGLPSPEGFDLGEPKGVGMRLLAGFVQQLNAQLDVRRLDRGAETTLCIPIRESDPE